MHRREDEQYEAQQLSLEMLRRARSAMAKNVNHATTAGDHATATGMVDLAVFFDRYRESVERHTEELRRLLTQYETRWPPR